VPSESDGDNDEEDDEWVGEAEMQRETSKLREPANKAGKSGE